MQDEYLDLVNEQDEVIGKKLRDEVYAEGLSNFRVVDALVVNSEGKIWVPRRTLNKRVAPGRLGVPMAGHVDSGETYDQAFRREVREELNLDIDETPHRFLGHLTPKSDGVSAFMNVYEITVADAPKYNPRDFSEFFWLTPSELREKLAQENQDDDLSVLIKKFY